MGYSWTSFLAAPDFPLCVATSGRGITHVYMAIEPARFAARVKGAVRNDSDPLLAEAREQLTQYLAGTRRQFDLPLDPAGTAFQVLCWKALQEIPYGETRTYGQQAAVIGQPNASRAVGAANGQNPISIIVPCHRVIGANGSLTGFGGGLDKKRRLLELEGVPFNRQRDLFVAV